MKLLVQALVPLIFITNIGAMEKSKISNVENFIIKTSQGRISILDSKAKGHPVLFIHGNSACGKVFFKQFNSELLKDFRLIALDLPGHGDSDPAKDNDTYSFPGYARVVAEVIKALDLKDLTIVGWSLGGHIALELSLLLPNLKGVIITGTPPIELSPDGLKKGFNPFDGLHLMGHATYFTRDEAKLFMGLGGIDMEKDDALFLIEAAMKTEGNARKYMIESVGKGVGADETAIVAHLRIPLAIVAGGLDMGINNDYIINEVTYNSLWQGVKVNQNSGHAVFWERDKEFNTILNDFLHHIHSK